MPSNPDKVKDQLAALKSKIHAEANNRLPAPDLQAAEANLTVSQAQVPACRSKNGQAATQFKPGNDAWAKRKTSGRQPGWYKAQQIAVRAAPEAMRIILDLARGVRVDPDDKTSRFLLKPEPGCAQYVVDRACGKPIQPVDVRAVLAEMTSRQVDEYIKQAIGVLGYGKDEG